MYKPISNAQAERAHIEATQKDCRTCGHYRPIWDVAHNCVVLGVGQDCTNHDKWTPVEFKQLTRSE